MREAKVARKTSETDIEVSVELDGSGRHDIATGIGFLDHMLAQLSRHGLIDLTVRAKGDLHIDFHHTTEDCGMVLGQAVAKALGDKQGIARYAGVYRIGACRRVVIAVAVIVVKNTARDRAGYEEIVKPHRRRCSDDLFGEGGGEYEKGAERNCGDRPIAGHKFSLIHSSGIL